MSGYKDALIRRATATVDSCIPFSAAELTWIALAIVGVLLAAILM